MKTAKARIPKAPKKTVTTVNPEFTEWQQTHGKEIFKAGIHMRSRLAVKHLGPFAVHKSATAEDMMYFPEDYAMELPEEGQWILITDPPFTEIIVPRMSIFFALPEVRPQPNGFALHLAKILTPEGSLWLWPHEYRKIDITKYLEFIGDEYEIKFLGGHDALPVDNLHYVMSRGIPKAKAIQLLLPALSAPDVCWLNPNEETQGLFK